MAENPPAGSALDPVASLQPCTTASTDGQLAPNFGGTATAAAPRGTHLNTFVGPNTATVGRPNAALKCATPESLLTTKSKAASTPHKSLTDSGSMTLTPIPSHARNRFFTDCASAGAAQYSEIPTPVGQFAHELGEIAGRPVFLLRSTPWVDQCESPIAGDSADQT